MPDITQAATSSEVVFSANSTKAEVWMVSPTVTFSLPADASLAANFRKRAIEADLTVDSL
jgi:hypothetical protein